MLAADARPASSAIVLYFFSHRQRIRRVILVVQLGGSTRRQAIQSVSASAVVSRSYPLGLEIRMWDNGSPAIRFEEMFASVARCRDGAMKADREILRMSQSRAGFAALDAWLE